jgi:uncharacterized protein YjiS (DUF1127 family)
VVTTIDPKLTGRKNLEGANSVPRTSNEAPLSRQPTTVVGRDLQALREVLFLHLADPQAGAKSAETFAANAPLIRQAAVKAVGRRSLQLYVCTPLETEAEEAEAPAMVPLASQETHHFLDVRRIWRYVMRQRELRRQRDRLLSMNDYMLRDIGIESRIEIAGLLHNHRYRGR